MFDSGSRPLALLRHSNIKPAAWKVPPSSLPCPAACG